jgi:hypothetical protein
VIFAAAAALVWPVLFARSASPGWLAALVAGFLAAAAFHDRVIRRRLRLERAVRFYERALARLAGDWAGTGPTGEAWFDAEHPYAEDLDVYGRGSLFQLLCAARTQVGERTLAGWLGAPAPPEQVVERQRAVAELRDRLDLREDLAVIGEDPAAIDDARLRAWAAAPAELAGGAWWVIGAALAAVNVGACLVWLAHPAGGLLLAAALAASISWTLALRPRVLRVLGRVERPEADLALLAALLARLEVERFESGLLGRLVEAIATGDAPASRRIARLVRLVELRDSRENALFRPFAALVLFGTQLAFAMERWRARSGSAVARWLDAVGQIEALSSLAQLAFERSRDPFPEVGSGAPRFAGTQLGHPLLPQARVVPNDVRLDASLQLLLVSGSNMSGKSTLLRTVGVNAVLAQAGGTVCAQALALSWLDVGACLHVRDSLQQGTSHLYAELRRLRRIVGLGGEGRGVLFLLDEILHGTNSHDRRIGAEGVIRSLVRRGAIGIVTTHDLALASIAEDLAPRARNVHFEDRLEDGRIVFDYRLREGVVRRSNALDLMRSVGLDV